jgi:hypothetical protein
MTTGRVKDSRSEFLWIEKLRAGVSRTAIRTYYRGGGGNTAQLVIANSTRVLPMQTSDITC